MLLPSRCEELKLPDHVPHSSAAQDQAFDPFSHGKPPAHAPAPASRNHLLAALTPAELARLQPHLVCVRLVYGQGLHERGERIEHAYFVETGLVSTVADVDQSGDDTKAGMIETSMVGPEGFLGSAALLRHSAISYGRSFVQIAGIALRIPVPALQAAVQAIPALERRLLDALQITAAEVAQTVACNTRHAVPERLARWLLMAHDRAEGDELPLTQEVVAIMLGVRRPGVTIASAALERAGLIQQKRGRIIITDRKGLEAASCGCYARVRAFAAKVER